MLGRLYVVGIGPGSDLHMTGAALGALSESEVIVGYDTYIGLIGDLIKGKMVISTGMTREVDRCSRAVELAFEGKRVAVVSSGDSGIYGMAGLVYELLAKEGWDGKNPGVTVIPGISSMGAAASLLGAPLMHDFAVISLSDLLTPWEIIRKRIEAAASADFVMAIYNPASKKRKHQIAECREIVLKYRSPQTPVGIVTDACREGERVEICTLDDMLKHEITMTTTIIIGNNSSFQLGNLLITPRGYEIK